MRITFPVLLQTTLLVSFATFLPACSGDGDASTPEVEVVDDTTEGVEVTVEEEEEEEVVNGVVIKKSWSTKKKERVRKEAADGTYDDNKSGGVKREDVRRGTNRDGGGRR